MHPSPSVIFFTVFSGMGFGLLAFLGLGFPAVTGQLAFVMYTIGFGFAVGGLLASTFHLGNPKNALKAFSQWRTSWLSREAVLSVAALLMMAAFAIGAIFAGVHFTIAGIVGALLCIATVFSTSMIYAQLKTVPRWNHVTTPLLFLVLSVTGGALLAGQVSFALPMLIATGAVQALTWYLGDSRFAQRGSTIETATGLGMIGKTRQFEPPHTGGNYLLNEMVYVIGRKHSMRLRVIAITLMSPLPFALLLLPHNHIWAALAVLSHIIGVVASRWLFFAEAEHVVGLYYNKR